MVEIISYSKEWHDAFRQLNLEWLDKYNLREEADMVVLNDPQGMIVDKGGVIYLAKAADEIVGTAALIHEGDQVYELAKMSVTEQWQGKGISKLLLETCLQKANELGAVKIELFSNHQLKNALKLYEKYGFEYIEMKDSPFETADIKMELILKHA
ncbi:GNAT family N-acetyltransferase [Lacibacter sediminis]|uniref:GNAT family N-acetyltransferase n=1 Tax=Lacibacter sediminis TaxID=2760713 RepID=A0A7G5XBN7_9BACT|nr:GNAT family N-acetyltransferase [Lacibacter sediminis]QNA42890.1 GNAT family N-acetyltransferase [Lacibacter sediminis]